MRREIASKLRRAASVLRTVMLWASLAVLIVFFGKDPPTEQTGPRRKGKGLNLNDDPNPWYMLSQYRFGSGNSAAHNRWHK